LRELKNQNKKKRRKMNGNTVMLLCPFCLKEGKKAVETPKHSVFVPALLTRWVPRWAQEKGFLSLESAVFQAPGLSALIRERNGRKTVDHVCRVHKDVLREAMVWTDSLLHIEEKQAKAAAAKRDRALGTIASLLDSNEVAAARQVGEKVDKRRERQISQSQPESVEPEAAVETIKVPRKLARKAEKAAGKPPKGKAEKTKGRKKNSERAEIEEALRESKAS
ncbi:MAG: hypothetical protein Q8P03_01025, partial [bacterium]|nr:hypothetical protein [bacterium]